MVKIIPINGHVLVKPVEQKSSFSSAQATFEERGEVIGLPNTIPQSFQINIGDFVYFDSWRCARYLDGEGQEHWVVPEEAIRAIEILDGE